MVHSFSHTQFPICKWMIFCSILYHLYQQIKVKGDIYKKALKNVTCFISKLKVVPCQIYNMRFFLYCQKGPHVTFFLFLHYYFWCHFEGTGFPQSSELPGSASLMRSMAQDSLLKTWHFRGIPHGTEKEVKEVHRRTERPYGIKGFPQPICSTPHFQSTAGLFLS